jgi:phosphonate transport system substrate-binding protein
LTVANILRRKARAGRAAGVLALVWCFALGWFCVCALAVFAQAGEPEAANRPATEQKTAQETAQETEYAFGFLPLHNPEKLFEVYAPLTAYLTAHIPGARFRLEASRDYATFDNKLLTRQFQFALANPYQTCRALNHGYQVFAKFGDDSDFRGLILVRRDSGVEKVPDLKGKSVSFLSQTTLGTTMLPQYYLHTHGLNVNTDIRSLYVGTHESSIMNVYHRFTAAGATRPGPWAAFQRLHPNEARELVVKWETESLPHLGLLARDDIPQPLVDTVAALLFALGDHEEGRRILDGIPISHIAPAANETYEPARAFLRRFSAEVRALEGFP